MIECMDAWLSVFRMNYVTDAEDFGESERTRACCQASVTGRRSNRFDETVSVETRCFLSIRTVAGFSEVAERRDLVVAEACNHPNCLVLPFRMELIRLAA
jgi:hypothetical protein